MFTQKNIETVLKFSHTRPENTARAYFDCEEELTLLAAQYFMESGDKDIEEKDVKLLVGRLISLYDTVNFGRKTEKEERAMKNLEAMAAGYTFVVDMVINNAKKYAQTAHIDDASPHAPNGFSMLQRLAQDPKVIIYLETVVRSDSGLPRWEAIEALAKIETSYTEKILEGIIRGDYPSLYHPAIFDLNTIARVRGQEYIDKKKKELKHSAC